MATAITDLRKLNRLSQSQLAEKAGLTQKTIGNYEKDISFIRNAQYKNIEKVAKALGVSVDKKGFKNERITNYRIKWSTSFDYSTNCRRIRN